MFWRCPPRVLVSLAAYVLWLPGLAWAYLGSFEEQDGYRVPGTGNISSLGFSGDAQFYLSNNSANGFTGIVPPGAFPHTLGDATHGADLSRYNAGAYGTNAGGPGGVAADIADNTSLWRALAGGRLDEDADAPFYLGNTATRDYVQAYQYPGARTGSQVLNFLASDVDLSYEYSLDARDFNGVSPGSTTAHLIELSFWLCPSDWDDLDTGHLLGLTFKDTLGQTLLEVGYTGDNFLQYRLPGGGLWQTTPIVLGTLGWSEIAVELNTFTDTASLAVRAYDDGMSTLGSQQSLLGGEPLGLDADALTTLGWDLRGGTLAGGAVSYKNYFEDFSFTAVPVPEPGPVLLLMLPACSACLVRRRS